MVPLGVGVGRALPRLAVHVRGRVVALAAVDVPSLIPVVPCSGTIHYVIAAGGVALSLVISSLPSLFESTLLTDTLIALLLLVFLSTPL